MRSTDPETGVASRMPEAAICVQDVDVQCVLQFTLLHAAGCALHRHTSRVIHRLELYFRFAAVKAASTRINNSRCFSEPFNDSILFDQLSLPPSGRAEKKRADTQTRMGRRVSRTRSLNLAKETMAISAAVPLRKDDGTGTPTTRAVCDNLVTTNRLCFSYERATTNRES